MKPKLFSGVATALITPFKEGKVDYDAFEKLVERQIEAGVDALVFCGTTGEAPTLTDKEKKSIYTFACRTVGKRSKVILGTSTNSHNRSMELSGYAAESGADALLCVTPYYNKGTQKGIERSYREICSLGAPVILYNIPSRTGVDIKADMLTRLSDEPNIVGVKECAGVGRISEHRVTFGDRYQLYSGNDSELLPSLSVGADGVVSVLSNLYPRQMRMIWELFREGKNAEARRIHSILSGMFSLMFYETNPAPVKYAVSTLSLCENSLRLPLCEIEENLCRKIDKEMKKIEQNI